MTQGNGGPLSLAITVLGALPGLIGAGVDVAQLIAGTLHTVKRAQAERRDPTAAEWDALNNQISALRAQLDRPEV